MLKPLAVLALAATPAAANPISALFSDRPCVEVIATIDAPEGLDPASNIDRAVMMSGAWGYLSAWQDRLPSDTEGRTLLQRLRVDCARSPEATALDLLSGYL